MTRTCPRCRKPLPDEPGPYRPFCSRRCKLLDLQGWFDGSYRLPGPEAEGAEDQAEVPQGESREAPTRD